ncbi:LysR family transcriptional regulator [Phaeobacter gallaeciensis]|uniref:LysR family transcriptional regulator n=2 Tax=Roseobacteraceae TaxID=2854170 RepID=A0A366X6M9_9RHOB|nr:MULTISPECIES: LysR family transcriptional regulator [Roseobacteraceae]MBT3142459.1 LysR family transcriptional regulator [Falsiruegeria litorea]MBT8169313.1 LysR family transcriptional regulator [Falsiruegeria litorea]RBW60547.1 LysR family transcriptional regulator [Phaeobacter gallaeciensis]
MSLPHQQRFPWNLDWNLLRTFMVIVEQRGISKAADFLGLKQPTVSAALKRLETATGRTLIIRKPNEFTITRSGHALYSECAKIFGSISQLPSLLNVDNAELRGHLSIATTSSVISEHFDDFLDRFSTAHPHVTYSFSVYESDEVETMISQNRASFGICLLSKAPQNLDRLVLYREFFGLFCGARHPLFHAKKIRPKDLEGEPFVAFQTEAEGGPLDVISRLRARAGLANTWRGVSSSLNEIRRMIMANVGIGALPLHVAKQDVIAGNIRQLPPYDDLPLVNIYLITNPARRQSDAEAIFLSNCEAELAEIPIEDRTYGAT